jgi:hypothetical protein
MLFSHAAVETALAPNPHPPFLIEGVVAAPTAFEVRGDGVRIGNQGKEDRLVSHLLQAIALRGVASSNARDSWGVATVPWHRWRVIMLSVLPRISASTVFRRH